MFLNLKDSDKIALIDDSKSLTYSELIRNVKKVSSFIMERSIVFCICENSISSIIAYLAAIEANAVPLLLAKTIDETLLDQLVSEYDPKYIFSTKDDRRASKYMNVLEIEDYCLFKTEAEIYKINHKLEMLLTTSGSTGSPKLVRHKKGNIESNSLNISLAFGWDENEIGLVDLPVNYTMGLSTVNTHLFLGATCIITKHSPMSKEYWNFLENNGVTNIVGVPFSYEIMDRLKFMSKYFPKLKSICQGGGKLSKDLFEKLARYSVKNNINFFATYGATETTARMTYLDPSKSLAKPQSIGSAMPLGNYYLLDQVGDRGELCYQGPNVTMGYALKKTDLILDDTWKGVYRTGDIVEIDSEGDMTIVGRIKRFVKLSGHRIALDDVENIVQDEFSVSTVSVGTDKKMTIFVENIEAQKTDIVREYISRKLGLYYTLIEVISEDTIKRKENGKIDYNYYNSLI